MQIFVFKFKFTSYFKNLFFKYYFGEIIRVRANLKIDECGFDLRYRSKYVMVGHHNANIVTPLFYLSTPNICCHSHTCYVLENICRSAHGFL